MSKTKTPIRVVRQLGEDGMRPKVQGPHLSISEKLDEVWRAHFAEGYWSSVIELGMIVILYLTSSPHVSAERVAALLTRTFPDLGQAIAANVHILADALGNAQE